VLLLREQQWISEIQYTLKETDAVKDDFFNVDRAGLPSGITAPVRARFWKLS